MPVYEAQCVECAKRVDYICPVSEYDNTPACLGCGGKTVRRVFSAPKGYVLGRFEAFKSTVDGSIISTQREMLEHNKRNDVVNLADGYSDEALKAGKFGKKEKLCPRELKEDVVEAYKKVSNGYKPQVEVYDE